MIAHGFNSSIWEAETGESRIQGLLVLYEMLSQKTKPKLKSNPQPKMPIICNLNSSVTTHLFFFIIKYGFSYASLYFGRTLVPISHFNLLRSSKHPQWSKSLRKALLCYTIFEDWIAVPSGHLWRK